MTYTYASSYISGLKTPIEMILKSMIKDVVIIKHLDGLVIYQTKSGFPDVHLPCFNNTYMVLAMAPTNPDIPYGAAVKKFIDDAKLNMAGIPKNVNLLHNRSFKIMPFDENSPTRINFDIIGGLERKIARVLNIKVGIKKHDFDIALHRRREGLMLLLFKLTYNRITEKGLSRGALRPELCYILSWISDIVPTDIILDPFCGHGSVPKTIVKHFSYNMLFSSDIDATLITKFKNEFKKNKKNLFIKQRDALNLGYFEDNFFDKIITDPPWNLYNAQDTDFSVFYQKMFREFYRILKPGGICTILMGNPTEFDAALDTDCFVVLEKYHILVNGKKANIYKLMKKI